MENEYVCMRDIGRFYAVSSHKVGRELKELGYRSNDGKPTRRAIVEKIVREIPVKDMPERKQWVWHKARVMELLEVFGWERAANDGTE